MSNFDDMKLAVEAISGGKNTVLFDDTGMPSIMVPINKMKYSDLIEGGTQETFPAFIVDGGEKPVIYFSKYINVVRNNRAYSLPLQDPKAYINFDTSLEMCKNKGKGWSLTPNFLWQAVALWSRKNGTIPHGNNNNGQDASYTYEKGTISGELRTATGSGPATWNHNWLDSGIADMHGNIWEWTAGFRLKAGEIQVIPYSDCMMIDANMSATSTAWKAILQDGALVDPGTAQTLKVNGDAAGSAAQQSVRVGNPVIDIKRDKPAYTGGETDSYYGELSRPLEAVTAASGVTVPQILKAIGIFPVASDLNGDYLWARNYGERLPQRGGSWWDVSHSGVFALYLDYPRSLSQHNVGFRAAFCNL